jgi:hypothetical protein
MEIKPVSDKPFGRAIVVDGNEFRYKVGRQFIRIVRDGIAVVAGISDLTGYSSDEDDVAVTPKQIEKYIRGRISAGIFKQPARESKAPRERPKPKDGSSFDATYLYSDAKQAMVDAVLYDGSGKTRVFKPVMKATPPQK